MNQIENYINIMNNNDNFDISFRSVANVLSDTHKIIYDKNECEHEEVRYKVMEKFMSENLKKTVESRVNTEYEIMKENEAILLRIRAKILYFMELGYDEDSAIEKVKYRYNSIIHAFDKALKNDDLISSMSENNYDKIVDETINYIERDITKDDDLTEEDVEILLYDAFFYYCKCLKKLEPIEKINKNMIKAECYGYSVGEQERVQFKNSEFEVIVVDKSKNTAIVEVLEDDSSKLMDIWRKIRQL